MKSVPPTSPRACLGKCGSRRSTGLGREFFIGKGKLAASNSEQVLKIRRILEELGLEIATPSEAREILALNE